MSSQGPEEEEGGQPSTALWNRTCDWADEWVDEWSMFGDYERRTMYHDYKKQRDELHTGAANDLPWSSRKRLTGVLTVCAIALSWVLAVPALVTGIVFGNWAVRMTLVGYCSWFYLFPQAYSPTFHQVISDLEIGRENGWKLLLQDPEALRAHKGPLLFLSHPHCVYQAAVGFLFASSTAARTAGIPKVKFCVHSALLWFVPLLKEFLRAIGSMPSDASSIRDAMQMGHSVVLAPGGAEEVMWAGRTDAEHVVLKDKYGFIKLAVREGLTVTPVWTFGESMGTGVIDLPFFQDRLKLFRWTGLPLRFVSLCQRWFLPFPNGVFVLAVGRPMKLGHLADPTAAQLEAAHARYVEALLQLVDSTKAEAGYPNIQVKLV